MTIYVQRLARVDAFRWDGDKSALEAWLGFTPEYYEDPESNRVDNLPTPGGPMHFELNEWILRDPGGMFHNRTDTSMNYEFVEEPT